MGKRAPSTAGGRVRLESDRGEPSLFEGRLRANEAPVAGGRVDDLGEVTPDAAATCNGRGRVAGVPPIAAPALFGIAIMAALAERSLAERTLIGATLFGMPVLMRRLDPPAFAEGVEVDAGLLTDVGT